MLGQVRRQKKSNGQKKAKGGVNIRQATSSLNAPSTSKNQSRQGKQSFTSAPVATSRQQRSRQPRIDRSGRGERIVHRELIKSVEGAVAFTVTTLPVNPGLPATFPWLSAIASKWDQYTVHKCNFEYITRTGTSTVGSVILAPDYDAADPPPVTEAQITAYEDSVEDAPWRDLTCVLKKNSMHPNGPRKFVRTGAIAGDIKTYDVANMNIAVLEEASSAQIGKLWVDYDIEFFVPSNGPADGALPSKTSYFTKTTSTAMVSNASAPIQYNYEAFDPLNVGVVSGVFTPPQGAYKIEAALVGTNSAAESTAASIEIWKNGAPCVPPSLVSCIQAGGLDIFVATQAILVCNGTDTFQIQATMSGATGVLQLEANASVLIAIA